MGVVRDQRGDPIPGATIEVVCGTAKQQTTADAAGAFQVTELPAYRCTATAAAPLFESRSVGIAVGGARSSVAITLPVLGFATEVVVTPGRGVKQDPFDLPEFLSVTTRRDIDSRPHQLLGMVLGEEPGVLTQRTTSAQVSPIIRGFTGQSNVYLVDGVRLNTATWRSGPSQYFSWVDSAVADRVEVVRGPGSVEYGSDALGGTIQVLTAPSFFATGGLRASGSIAGVFGAADRSAGGEAGLQLQLPRASIRVGGSVRSMDDLRAGGGEDSHAAVTRFLGLPSSVIGSRLVETGYDQSGASVAGTFDLGGATRLNALYVYSDQGGASRYDRILGGDGNYRSGFDPQRLDFGLVRYQRADTLGLDGVTVTFSLNQQGDGRYEQARPTARLDAQTAKTTVFGYQVQGHRLFGRGHQVMLGAELYDEGISAERRFTENSGAVSQQRPDIPDGTTYSSLGVFVQDAVDLGPRVNVRAGVRYGRFAFATRADDRFGVTADAVTTDALTFRVGSVIAITKHLNAVVNVAQGFRAANAADLGDIGLTGGGGFVITPSKAAELGGLVGSAEGISAVSTGEPVPALGPEVVYSYEGGLKFRSRRVDAALNVFDLEYVDTIQRRAIVFESNIVGTTIAGFEVVRQDAQGLAFIAQDIRPVATRINADRSRIIGFEAQAEARLTRDWTADVHFSMANGTLVRNGDYLRRMPPPLGGGHLRWSGDRLWIEGVVTYARSQTRLTAGDLSDARIGALRTRTSIASFFNGTATDLGLVQGGRLVETGETVAEVQTRLLGTATSAPLVTTGPGFVTFGLRAGWRFAHGFEIAALGENLADANYRLYGSGLDGTGANVQIRMRYAF